MPYIANTPQQTEEMLRAIGTDVEGLFADIPAALRCAGIQAPAGLPEQDVRNRLAAAASRNRADLIGFLGGGFYDHFIPAAAPALASRSEFFTSYTPYQPEISQGVLQAIYEFQSAICRITGMEVSNASLYDGGTALYEAIMMALRITGRRRVIVDDSVSPIYRTMVRTYTRNLGIELVETTSRGGLLDRDAVARALDDQTAAVAVQNPNFFGCLDDYTDLAESAHRHGALLIACVYPVSLGIVKTPAAMDADIVVGEGQSLGLPLSFGGPYLGFMAARMQHVRKMPGRISGRTVDAQGRQGFVLTLQAREQHIRREKATSNICTNQGLCALTALVFLSLLGKQGFRELATTCAEKASYAAQRLQAIPEVRMRFGKRYFFNEFVLELPVSADRVTRRLLEKGFAAGFPLVRYYPKMEKSLLVAVTEKRTKEEIDLFAHTLEISI